MRSLFRSKHRVTQAFNVNPDYYKKFGLTAHEGLDLVPTGSVWDVLCLADGVVVKDEDNALSGAYGKNVTVWHPKLNKATQYCHLKENYVVNGQVVSLGEKIGFMGSSGNTTGAHVHLNLFETDAQGIRLNRTNGFLGGVNPEPFLEEEPEVITVDTVPIEKAKLADLERCKDGYNQVRAVFDVEDSVAVVVAEAKKFVSLEDQLRDKEKQLTDAQVEASTLKGQVQEEKERNEKLASEASVLTEKALELEKKYQQAVTNNEKALVQIDQLKKDLTTPDDGWTLIIKGLNKLIGR